MGRVPRLLPRCPRRLLGLKLIREFLAYVGLVSLVGALVAAILLQYLPVGRALLCIAIVALWLGYADVVGCSGIVGELKPPRVGLLVAPVQGFAVRVLCPKTGRRGKVLDAR